MHEIRQKETQVPRDLKASDKREYFWRDQELLLFFYKERIESPIAKKTHFTFPNILYDDYRQPL